jgi:hypothetical protein
MSKSTFQEHGHNLKQMLSRLIISWKENYDNKPLVNTTSSALISPWCFEYFATASLASILPLPPLYKYVSRSMELLKASTVSKGEKRLR